jgi:hypothetical protein
MKRTVVGVAIAGSMLVPMAAHAAPAQVCDAYSSACPTVEPTKVTTDGPKVEGRKLTQPLTGGEFVGLIALGAGGLAAGTAFVVVSRRRRGTHAAS